MSLMNALVLFCKAPSPGDVKTRLIPDLSAGEAASLHEAFLIDTLDNICDLDGSDVHVACHPGKAHPFFVDLMNNRGIRLMDQGEGDLGERMKRSAGSLLSGGYDKVVIIGSDSPTMKKTVISDAFDSLGKDSLVIGPSLDGGYYLVGMSGSVPDIFDNINWGSSSVFDETLKRIGRWGGNFSTLPYWYDVDTIKELRYLTIHLESLPEAFCIRTREVIRSLADKLLYS